MKKSGWGEGVRTCGSVVEADLLELGVEQILHARVVQMLEQDFGLEQTVNVVEHVLRLLVLVALEHHLLNVVDLDALAFDVLAESIDSGAHLSSVVLVVMVVELSFHGRMTRVHAILHVTLASRHRLGELVFESRQLGRRLFALVDQLVQVDSRLGYVHAQLELLCDPLLETKQSSSARFRIVIDNDIV